MAHLLGSKNCIDSLSKDVADTQVTLDNILTKVGDIQVQSWKFPDKLATELDIPEILENYSYSKDEEFNRLAHIILFELVIDRLLLLLQSTTIYIDTAASDIVLPISSSRPKSKIGGSSISLGLAVKKFWHKIGQLLSAIQRQRLEMRESSEQIGKLRTSIDELKEENSLLKETMTVTTNNRQLSASFKGRRSNQSKSSSGLNISKSTEMTPYKASVDKSINIALECDFSDANTQTYETSFVPCEACSRMQQNLMEVGVSIISVCESQGLPSSLAKQKKLLRQSLMAANDVSLWAAEQSKDLQRINKHLDSLYAQINPLQEQVKMARAQKKALEESIKQHVNQLESQMAEKNDMRLDFEKRIGDLLKVHSSTLHKKEEEASELKCSLVEAERTCNELQHQAKNLSELSKNLAEENSTLNKDLGSAKEKVKVLTEQAEKLIAERDNIAGIGEILEETKTELQKTQAENKALTKHDKTLQSKYDTLLQRVDELDEECDHLQSTVESIEEEKKKMTERLQLSVTDNKKIEEILENTKVELDRVTAEKKSLRDTVEELKSNIDTMTTDFEDNKRTLNLLANFPVIDDRVPVNYNQDLIEGCVDMAEADYDIAVQMERQIQANSIRINILEMQNEKMRQSLEKLRDFQLRAAKEIPKERIPLWNNTNASSLGVGMFQGTDGSAENNMQNPIHSGREPQPRLTRPASSRISEKRQAKELGARIASASRNPVRAYQKGANYEWNNPPLQKEPGEALVAWASGRPKSARSDHGKKTPRRSPAHTFTCPDCDKMYPTQKDLNIHKSFCYGRT